MKALKNERILITGPTGQIAFPMAVELAKVSLWLDCFTLGAPLSFLDHHLKCGNSLLGVSLEEIQDILAADRLHRLPPAWLKYPVNSRIIHRRPQPVNHTVPTVGHFHDIFPCLPLPRWIINSLASTMP